MDTRCLVNIAKLGSQYIMNKWRIPMGMECNNIDRLINEIFHAEYKTSSWKKTVLPKQAKNYVDY